MAEKGTGLPEISVLMPAYNAERYIEAAIRSLEEQTVENWELIVVGRLLHGRHGAAATPPGGRGSPDPADIQRGKPRRGRQPESGAGAMPGKLCCAAGRGRSVASPEAGAAAGPGGENGGGHRLLLLCPDRRGGGEERRALCGARDDRFRKDAGLQHPQLLHGVHKKGSHAPL